jgi:hypothetical protein
MQIDPILVVANSLVGAGFIRQKYGGLIPARFFPIMIMLSGGHKAPLKHRDLQPAPTLGKGKPQPVR